MFSMMSEGPLFTVWNSPYIHAPFTIAFGGWLLWTFIQWGWTRDDYKDKESSFWHDYKDEATVSFIAMLMILIWDSQMLYAIDLALEWATNKEFDTPEQITPEMYLAIAPVAERLYTWGGMLNKKFKTKKDGAI